MLVAVISRADMDMHSRLLSYTVIIISALLNHVLRHLDGLAGKLRNYLLPEQL